ncbi:MAG: 30S ribosome-binding factor RbfA [Verrucomicrobia bacterium]|nr:30S ribosome-binding factor RbfA [Verrucomicrobiota bacterium]MBS0647246.1 30S ribosome-binding factor RbfA [Verrucomicrobiota bacterium]
MSERRIERLNSLLKEVISDVIRKSVKDPHLPELITVTKVEVTRDLSYAKVYVSVIESQRRETAIKVLNRAAGFIAQLASKEIILRYFPSLTFYLDTSLDDQIRIEQLIQEIEEEKKRRPAS